MDSIWQILFSALVLSLVCGCEVEAVPTIALDHNVQAPSADTAPICSILELIGTRRRGAVVEVSLSADPVRLIASRPTLDDAWSCPSGDVSGLGPTELAGCGVQAEEATYCLVSLATVLDLVEARMAALPANERGTLVLALNPDERTDTLVAELVAILGDFDFTEQIWVESESADDLALLKSALEADTLHNVRLALSIRDRSAITGGAGIDAAYEIGADIALVPARAWDHLASDASTIATASGGVAWGVYDAAAPGDFHTLSRASGLRMASGPLAPALADTWGIEVPEFDCVAFVQAQGSIAAFFAPSDDPTTCQAP